MTDRPIRFRSILLPAVALVAVALWLSATPAAAGDPPPADPGMANPPTPAPPANPPAPPANPPAQPPANPPPGPIVNVAESDQDLATFEQQLKEGKKSDTGDLIASLKAVLKHYLLMLGDEETYKAWLDKAEAAFIRAFGLVLPKGNANLRDDLNVEAAKALGQTRAKVTAKIIEILQSKFFKAKDFEPPLTLYDEAFKSIGMLSDQKAGLPFLTDFVRYNNTEGEPEKTAAACVALTFFRDLKGKQRLEIVKSTITTFVGVEHAAEVNKSKEDRAQKEVWDKIKSSVIKMMQHFTKSPKGKDGANIATMKGFWEWFKDNDKPNRDPWVDPKVAPGAPPVPAGAAPPAGK